MLENKSGSCRWESVADFGVKNKKTKDFFNYLNKITQTSRRQEFTLSYFNNNAIPLL